MVCRGMIVQLGESGGLAQFYICGRGGIGRRTSLRGWRWQHRGGSSPPDRTSSYIEVSNGVINHESESIALWYLLGREQLREPVQVWTRMPLLNIGIWCNGNTRDFR